MLIGPIKLRDTLSRGIGLLLIALIFHAATTGAAHRHGCVSQSSDIASVTQSDQSANPAGTRTGCNDCLLCQLHHNLNSTLITYRLVDSPERVQLRIPVTVPQDVLSHAGTATAGRAPPFIS